MASVSRSSLRPRRAPTLGRLLFGCALAAALPRAAFAASAAPAPGPRLRAVESMHDFGEVPQGQPARHEFKIANDGSAPLEISDVKPSCGCTTAGEWTRVIPPGGTGTIPLQLETDHFSGNVTKTITVSSNDPAHPQTVLEIKAAVWTPVQVSSPVIIFPALNDPAQVVSRSVTIRHRVEGSLQLTELRSDKPQFKPELKETIPGKEFELTVTTVPPLDAGTQNARITMKTSNARMADLTVQAVATVLPPVQVAPTEITLPAAKLAAPEKRYLVLLNHRGGDLQVSDLQTDAPGVEFSTNVTGDKKQITVTLTFPAGYEGSASDKRMVRGRTNRSELPAFQVPIVHAGGR